jgi:hypothetical protein
VGGTRPSGRGEWAGRLRDWLFDNDQRIAELLQRETGKPWQEATLEVPLAIDGLEYYRRRAQRFLADSHPRPHDLLTASKKLTVAYRPYQAVGVICPWNNPVLLALGDAVPALLAGAAVAMAGIVGFVGLAAPHMVRAGAGADPGRVLLPSTLAGAALLVAFGAVALVTALVGGAPAEWSFLLFAVGLLLLLLGAVPLARGLRPTLPGWWTAVLVAGLGAAVALLAEADPWHDLGLFLFFGAWAVLGLRLLSPRPGR